MSDLRVHKGIAAVAVAAALGLALTAAVAPAASRVRAPKSGKYTGVIGKKRLKLTLYISGKSVQIVAFKFGCGKTVGATSLESIRLRKSRRGYRFRISAHGIVSYRDRRPDQNAAVAISGTFSRTARTVSGRLRVRSKRCDTRYVRWRARR